MGSKSYAALANIRMGICLGFCHLANNLIWPTRARVQPLEIINLALIIQNATPRGSCLARINLLSAVRKGSPPAPGLAHTHTQRHKSNVRGTCKVSCSSHAPTERARPFGTARHVYHNRAINFIRLVPLDYNILWSLHFRQLQTVETEKPIPNPDPNANANAFAYLTRPCHCTLLSAEAPPSKRENKHFILSF